ncbi:hypothetical protein F5Y13DRAFT_162731 [Hypoxylon sp. FL1857]|nr:hypothetical protein F5Y13DRAFT_162731 [Hypoxylon sp. FL1857]
MSTNEETRPSPQSLPRLTIPTSRRNTEPEEITMNRVEAFLESCRKNRNASLSRLPSAALVLPPPDMDFDSDSSEKDKEHRKEEQVPANSGEDDELDTLDFTAREEEEMEAKKAAYEYAKAQHTNWILELQADPKDRKAISKCRYWRLTRERLNLEMSMICRKRNIRKNFRTYANEPEGIENW